jgi:hypothetical protein
MFGMGVPIRSFLSHEKSGKTDNRCDFCCSVASYEDRLPKLHLLWPVQFLQHIGLQLDSETQFTSKFELHGYPLALRFLSRPSAKWSYRSFVHQSI